MSAQMATQVGKYAANKVLKKQMKGYSQKKVETGADPYFAMVEDPRHPGKLKKVKKQVPAYIPEQDAEVLAAVRRRAYRLDMCLFNLFGIRFGWEAVIGLVPLAGDAIGALLALLLVRKCMQVAGGLEHSTVMRMLINIALDFAIGLVPFIGDLADAAFKCNTRNLRLLERVLDKRHKPSGPDERDAVGVDRAARRRNRQSGIYTPNDPPPATAFEDFSDDELLEQNQAIASKQAQSKQQGRNSWFGGRKAQSQQVPMAQPVATQQQTGTIQR